ncbi:MAG: methionine sulfoxide reductase heme-binding subunit [Aliidongia sp.]|nr:methionine sulfoxide reductase heme-binding subunit [Aliidongia sp.]
MLSFPWRDRTGRFLPQKAVCFAALFLPGLWVLGLAVLGDLGARPVTEAIHQLGLWAIRLLFLALAITPLRQAWRWHSLLQLRRMIGVAAFAYAVAHVSGYVVDQSFDLIKVITEIVSRFYLTIGAVALLVLAPLTATSTDAMIRRLGGRNWRNLHKLSYGVAALVTVHFFLQSKLLVDEATVMGGLYLWLMGYRLLARSGPLPLWQLAGLSVASAVLTGLGEALYFGLTRGADLVGRVLTANFSTAAGIRPAIFVLAITLAVTLVAQLRAAPRRAGQGSSPSATPKRA